MPAKGERIKVSADKSEPFLWSAALYHFLVFSITLLSGRLERPDYFCRFLIKKIFSLAQINKSFRPSPPQQQLAGMVGNCIKPILFPFVSTIIIPSLLQRYKLP